MHIFMSPAIAELTYRDLHHYLSYYIWGRQTIQVFG